MLTLAPLCHCCLCRMYFYCELKNSIYIGIKGIPILLLHGWPGSVWEFYKMIPLLTNDKDISFDVVCPSLPGYGFSQASQKPGMPCFYV